VAKYGHTAPVTFAEQISQEDSFHYPSFSTRVGRGEQPKIRPRSPVTCRAHLLIRIYASSRRAPSYPLVADIGHNASLNHHVHGCTLPDNTRRPTATAHVHRWTSDAGIPLLRSCSEAAAFYRRRRVSTTLCPNLSTSRTLGRYRRSGGNLKRCDRTSVPPANHRRTDSRCRPLSPTVPSQRDLTIMDSLTPLQLVTTVSHGDKLPNIRGSLPLRTDSTRAPQWCRPRESVLRTSTLVCRRFSHEKTP
jgi:hypothetical protein